MGARKGYAPSVNILEAESFLSEDVDISNDIQGLAEAATDRSLKRVQGTTIQSLGVDEFDNYVDYIQTQIPKNN